MHYRSRITCNYTTNQMKMKQKKLALAILLAALCGCSSSDESSSEFHVRDVANSGCKSTSATRSENPEYFEFKALPGGYLSVNHVNAMFNCEPGKLIVRASIDGHTIKIVELEETALANCICPYDLYCEVGPLSIGDYEVIFYRGSYENPVNSFSIHYDRNLNWKLGLPDICTFD